MKKGVIGVLCLALAAFLVYGCGQGSGGSGTVSYSVINGTVKDTSGTAISGVRVTTSVGTADSNSQGYFSISNVSTTREVVVFSKTGQLTTSRVVSLTAGQAVFVDAVMVTPATTVTLNSIENGGTASGTSGSLTGTVTLPANALVDSTGAAYTGSAQVTVTPFNPTASPEAFIGGFSGVRTDGTTAPFQSFGYIDVTITDASGNALSMASGKTATIIVPVASSLTADAAATGSPAGTIPLWYYNSSTGRWIEEGVATFDATANAFVGYVSHFTPWNVDYPYTPAYITGRVVDASGNPVQWAEVRTQSTNNTWVNGGYYSISNGTFGPIPVQPNVSFIVFATKGGIRSSTYTKGPYASGTTDIGDIVLSAPLVQLTLTWGANPSDLDSHLTVPASVDAGDRYDLYYGNRSARLTTRWPYVDLDTDDVTSYGPEITSIYKLYAGTYRFNVHHYSGSGGISSSEANVNLIVSGGGSNAIYNFTPPSGLTRGSGDVWQVCDITIDSSGNVSGVSTLNGVLHGISAGNHNAFSPGSSETTSAAGVRPSALEIIKK